MRDVRPGLAAGEASGESTPDTDGGYDGKPDPMAAVRAVRIKISSKMAWKNPEYPYPNGDMEHTVIVLVLFTFNETFFMNDSGFRMHFNMQNLEPQRTQRNPEGECPEMMNTMAPSASALMLTKERPQREVCGLY
jgi:hypothetical protein